MTAHLLEMWHHPDALMPDARVKVPLDPDDYPSSGPWTLGETRSDGVVLVGQQGGRLAVTVCGDGLIRFQAVPGPQLPDLSVTERLGLIQVPKATGPVHIRQDSERVLIDAGRLHAVIALPTGDVTVQEAGTVLLSSRNGGFRFATAPGEYSGHRSLICFDLDPQDRFFGGGGRIMRPDRTGLYADHFAVKAGLYSGDYGGFPVPFFLSPRGYGIFYNNPWPHLYCDFGRCQADTWWVHAPGGDCDLFVLPGPEFSDLLHRFTGLVGRLPEPRRWWQGFWGGSLSQSRAEEVLAACRRFRSEGLPIDAMHIDGQWRSGPDFLQRYMEDGAYISNDFDWDPGFGDGPGMVTSMRAMNVRPVLHVNSRPYRKETTERGVVEGWLRRQGHETVARVGDPKAEQRYRELIAGRNAEGIGCWLQDHGDRVSGEVLPGIPSRNLFGALWARATTVTGKSDGDPAQVVFTRGAGIGGQPYCIAWSGDTRIGIDFFEEDLWYLLNAGLAGYPLASCDLGGYMFAHRQAAPWNVAFDPDNLARRLCQSLFFMPVPRTQDDARDPPKYPWNCPPPIDRLYAEMLKLRYRMIPYHYSYAVQAARTGEPILRPMIYHYRHDRTSWSIHDQALLGEWLLVAPILRKGAEHRAVWLPAGRWYDFWNDCLHQGPKMVQADAPFDQVQGLPVFVKAGAILPSQDDVDHLTDEAPSTVQLDVYPEGDSSFVLNDNLHCSTRIDCRATVGQVALTIGNALPRPRTFRIHLHGVPAGTRLLVNGRSHTIHPAVVTIPPR